MPNHSCKVSDRTTETTSRAALRHLFGVTLLIALWLPLQWLVSYLTRAYPSNTPAVQFAGWELALTILLLAVPVWVIRRLRLIEARQTGDEPMH